MLVRALGHVPHGFYIDVGAQDPVQDSVSLAFYEAGWRGVHVEPIPEYAQRLEEARPDERVVRAVLRCEREPMMFYVVADTGMSTGDPQIAAQHLTAGFTVSTLLVDSMPLSEILDGVGGRPIHWLKVDVEGMEQTVLQSWGDSSARPWVVVVESTRPNSTETTHHEWEHIVFGLDYEFVYFDGLNRFYVSREHPELKAAFSTPPNYFDDFSVTQYSFAARVPLIQLRELEAERQAVHERAEKLTEHARAADDHVVHLIGRINELDAAIKELSEVLSRQTAEAEAEQALSAKLVARRDRLEAELATARVELDNARVDLDDTRAELARARAEHDDTLQMLEHHRTHQAQLDLQRDAERRNLQDRFDGLQQRNQALEETIVELRTSTSWKLTRIVRLGGRLTRRLVQGGRAWLLLKPGSRPRRIASKLFKRSQPASPAPTVKQPSDNRPPFYVLVGHTVDCPTNTGVQRVVRGLCKALLADGRVVRFVKWDDALNACVLIDVNQRARLGRWNGPAPLPAEQGIYPPEGRRPVPVRVPPHGQSWLIVPEVPHMTFGERPVTARIARWARSAGLKSGFLFYDSIPLRRPEFAAAAPVHARYMEELREADAVWPISRWSADDLASFWSGEGDGGAASIHPIHLPPEFAQPRVTQPVQGEKMILSVGTVEPRKNQVALIQAFQQILSERGGDWRLVLVGNLHPLVAPAVDAATAPGSAIEFRGHVSDEELSELYRRCAFTVFPSLEEGYGLPILESLWQGKPCVCADFGAMSEVAAGGGCLTVDVRDVGVLRSALERLMNDGDLCDDLAHEAVDRAMPEWRDYLAALDAVTGSNQRFIYYWIDSTVATPVNTGIQRVVRQLARALLEAGFQLVPVKWGGPEQPLRPVSLEELDHFALWNGPTADQWSEWRDPEMQSGSWFLMGELPLHYTDAEQQMIRAAARSAKLKLAAVFYDTIPWKMRDIYPEHFANAHLLYIRELHHYDRVVAISHYSQQEMIKVLREDLQVPGPFGNILACPLPAEFPERSEEVVRKKRSTPKADRFVEVLCVGTVEPRKNHERMLDAFERAVEHSAVPLRLVLVGGGHSIEPDLAVRVRRRVEDNPAISWEEKADDARIRELYRRCDFTIYPSVEEGFGMPILESLWYGKPAICAGFGAMREVGEGGGCVMVDVTDVTAMAEALCELAASPELLAKLTAEAGGRRFETWGDYALAVAHKLDLWIHPDKDSVRTRRQVMGCEAPPPPARGKNRRADLVASA